MANIYNTKFFIANEVARLLEQGRLTNIDEDSKFATEIRDMLPFYTEHVLRRSGWRDATTRGKFVKLTQDEIDEIGSMPEGLTVAYEVPANVITVLGTSDGEFGRYRKELHPTKDLKILWLPNEVDGFIYVKKITDYSILSTDICLLIALYLADSLASSYLTDSRKVRVLRTKLEKVEYEYKSRDIQETGQEDIDRRYDQGQSDFDDIRYEGFGSRTGRLSRFYRGY